MFSKHLARALMIVCAGVISMGAAAAQAKVAIINVQKAIIDTAEIKKAQADLEAKYKPRTTELEKLQKELQDIQAQLQSGKLNQQAEQELQARGQRRQREYQRVGEDLQGDVDRERNEILQKAGQRMTEVVKKIAEERGLDVVIDVTNTVYFKPALDITAESQKAFDAAYPVK
jgi:outer membrane protein